VLPLTSKRPRLSVTASSSKSSGSGPEMIHVLADAVNMGNFDVAQNQDIAHWYDIIVKTALKVKLMVS